MAGPNTYRAGPDERGMFGIFGGRFVAETLMPLVLEVERAYDAAQRDPAFAAQIRYYLEHYVGRPSPLYFAERLTRHCGGAKIYLKREDLNHTGAHKVNNTIGQILLARRMGKRRIIAETGAGQHGVATATVCALFDLPCVVYMGATDIERQAPNVLRMKLLGAEVRPVHSGTATLKDAMNEALRDWVANVDDTYYLIGTVAGPHPYPAMVRDFQCVIGDEVRRQMQQAEGRLPDTLIACVGGGSNAMGLFHPFLDDPTVAMIGVEAAGLGIETGKHAASLNGGAPGVLHGNRTYLLQTADGQIIDAHSISAGLDYPGIGPEHAWLHDLKRVEYVAVSDAEALASFRLCTRLEGIIPALEVGACHCRDVDARAQARAGSSPRHQSVGPRRQGSRYRRACRRGRAVSSRIAARFAALAREGRAGLVTYLTCGDPDAATFATLLAGLPAAGADLVEVGMPFSDPMADGPAIQAASLRALNAGMTLAGTLAIVARLPRARSGHADRAHGLLQSDLSLWRAALSRRCERRRRRRADRRRPAARA